MQLRTLSTKNEHDAPSSIKENLIYRANIINKLSTDEDFAKLVFERCKRDVTWWIDTFCWTHDPKKPHIPSLPFITYDFQVPVILEMRDAIVTGCDLLIEKSREMGLSWMACYVLEHLFLFHEGFSFKMGSWREDFVDQVGNMDSLMEKHRFNLSRQPTQLLQGTEHNFPFMKLLHGRFANSIIGETASVNFGSGGRRNAIVFDEYSKWEKRAADGSFTSTADVTKCRIFIATPNGSGNKYALLASGQSEETIKVVTLHWTLHPEKRKGCYYIDVVSGEKIPIDDENKAFGIWLQNRGTALPARFGLKGGIVRSLWYDSECERRSDKDIAQELDIDYARSGAPFFDMRNLNQQRACEYVEYNTRIDKIPYGKYITGDIVEIDNRVIFREKKEDIGGWLRVFELPEKETVYCIGGDVCEGLPKGDTNATVVRSAFNQNVVATIMNHDKPEEIALKNHLVSKWYNGCKTAVENNNHGYSTNLDMDRYGTNIYYTKRDETISGEVDTPKRGWSTNQKTRVKMLDILEEEVRKNGIEIRDDRFISQCKTFVRPENRPNHPEADGDFKDDAVIALAISSAVLREIDHKVKSRPSDRKKMMAKDNIMRERRVRLSF